MEQRILDKEWTLGAYVVHNETLRRADKEHYKDLLVKETAHGAQLRLLDLENAANIREMDRELSKEQDRRYTEGNELRAMALKIKETADKDALVLDRASQTYRENRNDALREQSIGERGDYATRDDLSNVVKDIGKQLLLITDFMNKHEGSEKGAGFTQKQIVTGLSVALTILTILAVVQKWVV